MVFKRFRIITSVRVLLLTLTLLLLFYLVFRSELYATISIVGVLVIFQVWSLIRFVETSNRETTRFLESLEFSDFTQSFSSGVKGHTFNELQTAFADILARFHNIRMEKEENSRYLQTVVEHVGIGMIAFRSDGSVELLNAAVKRLLNIPGLKNLADLDRISPILRGRLENLEPGQRDLVTVSCNDEMLQLYLYGTELRLRQKRLMLVSLQNIATELNEKEMEAWQNLIRVLTHEIKNSLTPIASLASTVEEMLLPKESTNGRALDDNTEDIRDALQTIQKRSHGLRQFVDAYRDLTHIPKPEFEQFELTELLARVEKLIQPQISDTTVIFSVSSEPESIHLTADPKLVEQVLINLIINSIQALNGRPDATIKVAARYDDRGRVVVRVTDNGPGIVADAQEKLFVPFFTTKKGGSGIGLSLSRQIMRLHRGDLTMQSEPEKETCFSMRF